MAPSVYCNSVQWIEVKRFRVEVLNEGVVVDGQRGEDRGDVAVKKVVKVCGICGDGRLGRMEG